MAGQISPTNSCPGDKCTGFVAVESNELSLHSAITCEFIARRPSRNLNSSGEAESLQTLEVKMAKTPQWQNGCLQLILERVNHSEKTLFLPVHGLQISSLARSFSDEFVEEGKERWLAAYGVSDLVSWDATPLPPSATRRDEYCIPSTIIVTNTKKQTRREIPVFGKIRIARKIGWPVRRSRRSWNTLEWTKGNQRMRRNPLQLHL